MYKNPIKQHPKKSIFILCIFIFWFVMMFQLIQREYFPSKKNIIKPSYKETLKKVKKIQRRKMAIYSSYFPTLKLGTILTTTTPNLDGTYDIETKCTFALNISDNFIFRHIKGLFGFLGNTSGKFKANFYNMAHVGPDYQLKSLDFSFNANNTKVKVHGKVKGVKLFLNIDYNGQKMKKEMPLPTNTMMGNSFGLPKKFSQLKVGKKIRMRIFDPMTRQYKTSVSEVKGKLKLLWNGNRVETFLVESDLGALKSVCWVNRKGEILQYKVFSFIFIKELIKNDKNK